MPPKKRKQARRLSRLILTHELIGIIEKALAMFEQSLERVDQQGAKVILAKETAAVTKEKLAAMKQSDEICFTTFDSNEGIVIGAAIQLYQLDLSLLPQDAQRMKERRQCQQIAAYFVAGRA